MFRDSVILLHKLYQFFKSNILWATYFVSMTRITIIYSLTFKKNINITIIIIHELMFIIAVYFCIDSNLIPKFNLNTYSIKSKAMLLPTEFIHYLTLRYKKIFFKLVSKLINVSSLTYHCTVKSPAKIYSLNRYFINFPLTVTCLLVNCNQIIMHDKFVFITAKAITFFLIILIMTIAQQRLIAFFHQFHDIIICHG